MKKINALLITSIITASSSLMASPESSVTEISQQWRQNFNAGGRDSLMKLYSEEAVLFQPNNEILESTDSINDFIKGLDYLYVDDYKIWDVELTKDGNVAYETESWQATMLNENGEPISQEVSVTSVFEKQSDGSWKIKLQRWN